MTAHALQNAHPRFVCCHVRYLTDLFAARREAESETELQVGRRLRELRARRGLSLRALAEQSGLNYNTVSLIENGRTSPSVSTLRQLARALGAPMSSFFEQEEASPQVVFQKNGQRPSVELEPSRFEDLSGGLRLSSGQPLLVTLPPGGESGAKAITHGGQELLFCLEGTLVCWVGETRYTLQSGDSLLYEAHLPHRWQNFGGQNCRFLLLLYAGSGNEPRWESPFPPAPEGDSQ
ncbi:MAG: helix-turn-helix domain-containing protein [Candidatus Villigracilaceae bacterium]